MNIIFPNKTKNVVKLEKLYKVTEKDKLLLSERMSSRMIKSVSILAEGEYAGWQMIVPKKGLVSMAAYGTGEISEKDLKWMTEKTASAARYNFADVLIRSYPSFMNYIFLLLKAVVPVRQ